MKKRWIIGLFLVLVLAVASFVLVRYRQEQEYLSSHVFLGEDVYPMDARQIDLRGRDVTMEYHSLCQQGRFSLTLDMSAGTVLVDTLIFSLVVKNREPISAPCFLMLSKEKCI